MSEKTAAPPHGFEKVSVALPNGGRRDTWFNFGQVCAVEAQHDKDGGLHQVKLLTPAGVWTQFLPHDGAADILAAFGRHLGEKPESKDDKWRTEEERQHDELQKRIEAEKPHAKNAPHAEAEPEKHAAHAKHGHGKAEK